jgi:alpha-1,6-mannosyltransferase
VVVNAASALPEVVGDAGVAVQTDFAQGVREIVARPEEARRKAARARAERFGWPAAVAGFLEAHGLEAHGLTADAAHLDRVPPDLTAAGR